MLSARLTTTTTSGRRRNEQPATKLPQPPPQIDSKRRIMSKDISTPNPSFRVYYGGASVAVPFTWETAPGTPKHHSSSESDDNQIPLSPPPSFYSAASIHSTTSSSRSSFSSKRLLFLPLVRALSGLRTSSSRSFSSASSATAASFSPGRSAGLDGGRHRRRRCFSCSRLPVVHHGDVNDDDDDEDEEFESEGHKGNYDDVGGGSEIKLKRRSLSMGGGGWDSIGRMRNVLFGCRGGGRS